MKLIHLLQEIQQCTKCAGVLPLPPKPIIQIDSQAKLLIIGQAPGLKAHEKHLPFSDKSGDRLRQWLNLDEETFYDSSKVAVMPMGFCYPGKGKNGDLPPLKQCAQTWHQALLAQLPNLQLILLIGQYAQTHYLKDTDFFKQHSNLTQRVKYTRQAPKPFICLPHPSPRNQIWLKKNPWFEGETLPYLQKQLALL